MKTQKQLMGLVVIALLMPSAFADSAAKKEVVRIDFNKMIDTNSGDKSDLEKSVTGKIENQAEQSKFDTDKKKVVDFIDVEVNLSKERPLVDRRFNSVGEAKIATEFSVELLRK